MRSEDTGSPVCVLNAFPMAVMMLAALLLLGGAAPGLLALAIGVELPGPGVELISRIETVCWWLLLTLLFGWFGEATRSACMSRDSIRAENGA